ncbi:MAG: SPASM domain-containing protein [Bacteriovorax sp.]|jgi:MoaA/NifB/PqqE/SkfB family radical SAM enzyme
MYPFDLNAPIQLKIDEIQSNEFVYLKLPEVLYSDITSTATLLNSLTKKTDRLFFSIDDLSEFHRAPEYADQFPVAWFGISVPVGSNRQGFKSEYTIYSNVDSLSLDFFQAEKSKFKDQHKVIPEFRLTENHYQLGPTIAEFFERYKLPFAFISIEGAPDQERIQYFRETFETLRIKGFKSKIYFSFNNPYLDEWNIKTRNTFSGIQTVHIDLSNKCTHSCVFCSLWGPEFIDAMKSQTADGILAPEIVNLMNCQMPYERAVEILESLPETIQSVQFGGAGDPLTHPRWLDVLSRWRSRGPSIEVLTNFEYPSFEQLESLHQLSRGGRTFDFMVNVSAATPEVYKTVRPRQSASTFEKVISNIRYSKNLQKRDGHGVSFTMIHIINVHNFREAVKMVELAHELNTGVWLKPLEVHSEIHKKYSVPKIDYPLFQQIIKQALKRADELKVRVVLREFLEAIVRYDADLEADSAQFNSGLSNGQLPGDLYQTIPCTVGFTYVRFEVDGSVKPCCAAPVHFGNVNSSKLDDIWHSDGFYTWREKFLNIERTSFHLKDTEYGFCQICPHVPINVKASRLLAIKRN